MQGHSVSRPQFQNTQSSTLFLLYLFADILLEAPQTAEDRHAQQRMKDMHDLIELTTSWFNDVQRMDASTLAQLMKMGAKVQRLLEFKDKLKGGTGAPMPLEQDG